jgi:SAM-dependent methyltransferase
MAEPISPEPVMRLGLAFWASKTFLSAVELGLFTRLAHGPADLKRLEAEFGLHPRSSRDFFDALVALGMLERNNGLYANTPVAALYLDRRKPTYIGGILEMAGTRLYPFWGSLTEGLKTGKPQNEAKHGGGLFEKIYETPESLKGFLSAMTGLSLAAGEAIAEKFPWGKYKTFVDVGCAQGGVPVRIAQKHAHLSGGGFDLPAVGPIFLDYVKSFGLEKRLRFAPGDMFKDPLPAADVIVMGHILHDWGLDAKKQLLRKAHEALPAGGSLIVFEAIIDDERRKNAFGLLMSLNMLIETPDGFDYTGEDCCGWMRQVGFRETRVEPLIGPDSMVIGIK